MFIFTKNLFLTAGNYLAYKKTAFMFLLLRVQIQIIWLKLETNPAIISKRACWFIILLDFK